MQYPMPVRHDSERSKSNMVQTHTGNMMYSQSKNFVEDSYNIQLRDKMQTSMGQSMVNKYRNKVESENMLEYQKMAGLPTSQSQVNYLSVRQHPNPMFGTLDPKNFEDNKVLLDFY